MKHVLGTLSILCLVVGFAGCATFGVGQFNTEGAKASAVCTKGGPGGTLGIGPGGLLAMAKVNDDFQGAVVVNTDCSMAIKSE